MDQLQAAYVAAINKIPLVTKPQTILNWSPPKYHYILQCAAHMPVKFEELKNSIRNVHACYNILLDNLRLASIFYMWNRPIRNCSISTTIKFNVSCDCYKITILCILQQLQQKTLQCNTEVLSNFSLNYVPPHIYWILENYKYEFFPTNIVWHRQHRLIEAY